jgi:hypothetical protein
MANRTIRNPQVVYPGSLTQVPRTTDRTTYLVLNDLQRNKLSAVDFPLSITDGENGNILVFNGSEWVNQDWVPVPFAFGALPVDGQLLTLNPQTSEYGMVVNLPASPTLNAVEVRNSGGTVLSALTPSGGFEFYQSPVRFSFSSAPHPDSGMRGLTLNRVDQTDQLAQGLTLSLSGGAKWDTIALDYDSAGYGGNPDLVLAYDHSGLNNFGADVFRISAAAANSHRVSKFALGWNPGSPRNFSNVLTVDAGPNLGGISTFVSGGATVNHETYTQRQSNHSAVRHNYNGKWIIGTDINAANDPSFYTYDNVQGQVRLYIRQVSGNLGQIAINGTNCLGLLTVNTSSAAAENDVPQVAFVASYAALANRSPNITQLRDGSTVNNFMMLNGAVSGTAVTPKFNSSFANAWGLWSTDNNLRLCRAPAGNNQSITSLLSFDTSNQSTFGGNVILNGNETINGTLSTTGAINLNTVLTVNTAGTVAASGRVRGLGAYAPVIALFVAYTPAVTGADTAEIEVPYHPKDGTTSLLYNCRRIIWRVAASGSTSGQITVQKSTGTGVFSATTVGSVVLPTGSYEANNTSGLGTVTSGDKLRVLINNLASAAGWTVCLAVESQIPPE